MSQILCFQAVGGSIGIAVDVLVLVLKTIGLYIYACYTHQCITPREGMQHLKHNTILALT